MSDDIIKIAHQCIINALLLVEIDNPYIQLDIDHFKDAAQHVTGFSLLQKLEFTLGLLRQLQAFNANATPIQQGLINKFIPVEIHGDAEYQQQADFRSLLLELQRLHNLLGEQNPTVVSNQARPVLERLSPSILVGIAALQAHFQEQVSPVIQAQVSKASMQNQAEALLIYRKQPVCLELHSKLRQELILNRTMDLEGINNIKYFLEQLRDRASGYHREINSYYNKLHQQGAIKPQVRMVCFKKKDSFTGTNALMTGGIGLALLVLLMLSECSNKIGAEKADCESNAHTVAPGFKWLGIIAVSYFLFSLIKNTASEGSSPTIKKPDAIATLPTKAIDFLSWDGASKELAIAIELTIEYKDTIDLDLIKDYIQRAINSEHGLINRIQVLIDTLDEAILDVERGIGQQEIVTTIEILNDVEEEQKSNELFDNRHILPYSSDSEIATKNNPGEKLNIEVIDVSTEVQKSSHVLQPQGLEQVLYKASVTAKSVYEDAKRLVIDSRVPEGAEELTALAHIKQPFKCF